MRGPFLLRSELFILLLLGGGGVAENAAEDRVDVFEMVGGIDRGIDRSPAAAAASLPGPPEPLGKAGAALPCFHRVFLHEPVGVLAADAGLGQREQYPLRVDEAAERVEIPGIRSG